MAAMNRRSFAHLLAASAAGSLAAPALTAPVLTAQSQPAQSAPPYSLSVMLWTVFRKLPPGPSNFEQRLAKVAEAGYRNVELVGEYDHWQPADFDRAKAACKRHGIHFDCTAGLPHGIGNPADRDAFLGELRHSLTIMETLSIPAIIVLTGNAVPDMPRETQRQSCIEGLKRAASLVEGRQINGQPIRILLETIDLEENPHYFLPSAAEAIEIVRAANHPQVQFLYDLYHGQIAEGNLIEKLEKNIDNIGLIHVADVPGRHDPGTGEINYANIFRKLRELNYRHTVAMEFYPKGDEVAGLAEARRLATS